MSSAPHGLLCDLLARGTGIPEVTRRPNFSWVAGNVQTARQLRVMADRRTVWDSGRVEDDAAVAVPCSVDLAPGDYTWQVRTWDAAGDVSPWSRPMAFLSLIHI